MVKIIVLLAGYPATGKSFLCNKIIKKYPAFEVVSQDDKKEKLWDKYGFCNIQEKIALEMRGWECYYNDIDQKMKLGKMIISDYPFSEKQKEKLESIAKKNYYKIITIRLVGDIDVLYERSKKRDLSPDRHLGHLVSHYHKGDKMVDRSQADCFVTYEIFKERCLERGYDTFELGYLIEVDATEYNKINYEKILEEIGALLRGEEAR